MVARPMDILGLYRLHTALVTAAVPGIVAYMAGGSPFVVAAVVTGSVLHHAWGFSLNEIIDIEIDRKSGELSHKPLVSGRISTGTAWALSLLALVLSFSVITAGVLMDGGSPGPPVLFLAAATLSGGIYDLYGKRFPLSDIFVAFWMFFLVLAGASAVSGWGPFPLAVWAAASLIFLHILFNNSVEGGLKDVENDRRSGARTLAVLSGAVYAEGRLQVPVAFGIWGGLLRASFAVAAPVFVLFIAEGEDVWNWTFVIVPALGLFLFAHSMSFLGTSVERDRRGLIKVFAFHELVSFGLCMLVVLPAAGPMAVVVAFFAPLLWVLFFNQLVYRTGLAPKV